MSTRGRIDPRHARRGGHGGRNSRPVRPDSRERPGTQGGRDTPLFSRAFWISTAICGLLYAMCAAAVTMLPFALAWESGKVTARVPVFAGESTGGESLAFNYPFQWVVDYLKFQGIEPRRTPWSPSGIDYGNTSVPASAPAERVYLAWQYNPPSLKTIPPGVNVLAPRWFYVEDDGHGAAVVNDLAHLKTGKNTNWAPAQYVTAAHEAGVKVWAEVFLSTPKLAKQIVTDAARRSEFISRMAGWVQQYDLDGIDFDFENMDPADAGQYTELIAQCKQALPPSCVVCVDVTVPVDKPDPDNWWQCYDREGLGRVADYVAVMTYDKFDQAPTAAIGWVDARVRAILQAVPADKLLLGVPFYGTDFIMDAPDGDKLTAVPDGIRTKGSRNIFPSSVASLLSEGFYTSGDKKYTVDYWIDKGTWSDETATMEYSFVDTNGQLHVMFCEDPRSLLAKGGLTAFDRLAGVAVWRMEFGTDPMWRALTEGMTGG